MIDIETLKQTCHLIDQMSSHSVKGRVATLAVMFYAYTDGSLVVESEDKQTELISLFNRIYDNCNDDARFSLYDYAEAIANLPISVKKLAQLDDDSLSTVVTEIAEYQRLRYDSDYSPNTCTYDNLKEHPEILSYDVIES